MADRNRPLDSDVICVLVTATGGGGLGEQLIKSLRHAGGKYRIVGTDISSVSAGALLADEFHVIPPARDASYIDALLSIARDCRAATILVGSDAELRAISDARSRLSAAGLRVPLNPPEVLDTCLDKANTMRFLESNGFGPPTSWACTTVSELEAVDTFPVVVKPCVGGGGSKDTFIAQGPEELALYGASIIGGGRAVLAQEYMGTPEHEYTVGVLLDETGTVVNSIAMRRLLNGGLGERLRVRNRTARTGLGEWLIVSSGISQGVFGAFHLVRQTAERIAERLGARHSVNIQCRVYEGRVRPFEINPRFSGTTFSRALVGYREVEWVVDASVRGIPLPRRVPYQYAAVLRTLNEIVLSTGLPRQPE